MKIYQIAFFATFLAGSPGLFADCTAEADCYTLCGTPFSLSCKCYTGAKKCKECTCTSPGCYEMGSCCCTRQDGSRNCTQVDSCGSGWGAPLPPAAEAGGSEPVIAVNRPDMPELSGLSFTWSENGAGSGSYTIRNPYNSGLVALEILWYFRTTAGVLRVITWADNWVAGASLLPATLAMQDTFDAYVGVRSGTVKQVIAMLSYAEFQDGRKVGDLDRGRLFTQRRREIQEAYVKLRSAFNAGGREGFAEALRSSPRDTPAEQVAKTRLRQIFHDEGIQAALADISRVLQLPLT